VALGLGVIVGVGVGVSVGAAVGVPVGVGLLVGVAVGVCIRARRALSSSTPVQSLASRALLNKRTARPGTILAHDANLVG
jgi:hypothetical protein